MSVILFNRGNFKKKAYLTLWIHSTFPLDFVDLFRMSLSFHGSFETYCIYTPTTIYRIENGDDEHCESGDHVGDRTKCTEKPLR